MSCSKTLSCFRLHHNKPRLTHYLEESNQGRGFIKEICFSSDGRVIGSPYGFGIRLLAFDPMCLDLSESALDLYDDTAYYPSKTRQLHEVTCLAGFHDDVVLSSAFSPHGFTLVTGCRSGKISWHQPVLWKLWCTFSCWSDQSGKTKSIKMHLHWFGLAMMFSV